MFKKKLQSLEPANAVRNFKKHLDKLAADNVIVSVELVSHGTTLVSIVSMRAK